MNIEINNLFYYIKEFYVWMVVCVLVIIVSIY